MSNSQDHSPSNNYTPDPALGTPHAQQDQSNLYAHGHLHLTDKTKAVVLPLSLALLITGWVIYWLFPSQRFMADIYALALAALCGLPIIIGALKELASGRAGLSLLVALAVIGAVAIGDFLEAGTVAFILQLAILVEELAERGATSAVTALARLAPPTALVRRDGTEQTIPAEQLRHGDRMILRPGDRIPADGQLVVGSTSVDQSMISGEALPVDRTIGDELLAGTINLTGAVEVDVTRVGTESALGNIIQLVRRAQTYQPEIIRLADRFFAYYTPVMIVLALVVYWFTQDPSRTISMFLVGCACPILLSSPIAICMALFRAGQAGVLVKAGPFIEASANIRTVVFDKTGTLTTGKFHLQAVLPRPNQDQDTLLGWAASAEQRSNHPLAQTIVNEAIKRQLTLTEPENFEVLEGMGVRATIGGKRVAIGSQRVLLDELHLDELPDELAEWQGLESPTESIPVFVIVDGQVLGTLLLADQIRPEAAAVCAQLRTQGIRRICLLTGDRKAAVQHVARAIGANDAQGELLPADKVAYIRNLQQMGHTVAMLGDGINDAPSLTVADIGIAMGIHGTDVATEASDAVLLQDDLKRLPFLIALSKATHRAIVQNLLMAVLINITAIFFAAAGYIPPWAAAIIHNLGGVLVFLNSFRLANFKWQFATYRKAPASATTPAPPTATI